MITDNKENIVKEFTEFTFIKLEQLSKRYIEAEKFINELNWFERLFCSRKIKRFLKSRLKEYDF